MSMFKLKIQEDKSWIVLVDLKKECGKMDWKLEWYQQNFCQLIYFENILINHCTGQNLYKKQYSTITLYQPIPQTWHIFQTVYFWFKYYRGSLSLTNV